MKKRKFAICDREAVFACNLMEYMTQRKNVPFEVQVFSEMEKLEDSLAEEELEMLLIASGMMEPKVKQFPIGQILILSEGEMEREWMQFPSVYKYQPSEMLMAEILDFFAKEAGPARVGKPAGKVIGVYGPLSRCGKTCFALTLGQILAEREAVLYLNLEEYSGFEELLEKEFSSDLLDVMYFLKQKKENSMLKLNASVQRIGKLDAVFSVHSPADLKEIRSEEWEELLREIIRCGGYDIVILDLGSPVDEPWVLLSLCDHIYTPVLSGIMANAKMEHYKKLMREMELEEILEKTRYVHLPTEEPKGTGGYHLEQLTQSEMGAFVRMLLEEEGIS